MTGAVFVSVPTRIDSPRNGSHGHWAVQAKERREQRTITRWSLHPHTPPPPPWKVTICRVIGPRGRELDDDNLIGGAKSIRDEIAAWLGCGDGPKDPVRWRYEQQRGPAWATQIAIEHDGPPAIKTATTTDTTH